jgi:phthalate 4,5-dioxygenase reductase subunit
VNTVDGCGALQLVVSGTAEIAEGIRRIELHLPVGGELPEFTPGAHLRIGPPGGPARRYWLCNDSADRYRYEVLVKHEGAAGGGQAAQIERAEQGTLLACSLPRNDFPLNARASNFLFIAGGIGIAPVRSMLRHVNARGNGTAKLYYCTRSPGATAFLDELSAPEYDGQVLIHHDHGDPDRRLDLWPLLERPTGAQLYACGPRSMLEDLRDMTGHWSSAAVHFESLGPDAAKRATPDRAFRVRLARSGGIVDVAADQSMLDALRAHGVEVPSSCESGTCGTCRTRLVAGEGDHRDLVLSDDERVGHIMVCVSRARSDEIVIDR